MKRQFYRSMYHENVCFRQNHGIFVTTALTEIRALLFKAPNGFHIKNCCRHIIINFPLQYLEKLVDKKTSHHQQKNYRRIE